MATPTPNYTPFYAMPEDNPSLKADLPVVPEGLPEMKPEDMQYFGKLLQVSWDLIQNVVYFKAVFNAAIIQTCPYTPPFYSFSHLLPPLSLSYVCRRSTKLS